MQTSRYGYARVRTMRSENPPSSMDDYLQNWERLFDDYASHVDEWHRKNSGYHKAIASLAGFYTPAGERILELGSGTGDLLAALKPSDGWGIDISGEMVRLASSKYPHLKFEQMAARI